MKDYTQLSLKERQQIGTFLDIGYKRVDLICKNEVNETVMLDPAFR